MIGMRKSILAVLFLFVAAAAAALAGTERSDDLAARLDRIFVEAYPATGPGAAVLVVRNGKPILRKGYGLANVELSVPIAPEMVFRIGSVTKQFTAAAILKLVEAVKLSLSDEIGRFLPDMTDPNGPAGFVPLGDPPVSNKIPHGNGHKGRKRSRTARWQRAVFILS